LKLTHAGRRLLAKAPGPVTLTLTVSFTGHGTSATQSRGIMISR
jgi:hypothetical protein